MKEENNLMPQVEKPRKGMSKLRFVFRKGWFERWLWRRISINYTGSEDIPLSWESKRFDDEGTERVISFCNDAYDIGVGYPHEWHVIMRRTCFNKMIRWYLKKWAFTEWFGLRRWMWYKLLFRRCDRNNKLPRYPLLLKITKEDETKKKVN